MLVVVCGCIRASIRVISTAGQLVLDGLLVRHADDRVVLGLLGGPRGRCAIISNTSYPIKIGGIVLFTKLVRRRLTTVMLSTAGSLLLAPSNSVTPAGTGSAPIGHRCLLLDSILLSNLHLVEVGG